MSVWTPERRAAQKAVMERVNAARGCRPRGAKYKKRQGGYSPERRAAQSLLMKRRNEDPVFKQKMQELRASPAFKSALSRSMRAKHRDPHFAAKQAAAASKTMTEFNARPDTKLQRAISCRTLHTYNRGRRMAQRSAISPQALIPITAQLQANRETHSDD